METSLGQEVENIFNLIMGEKNLNYTVHKEQRDNILPEGRPFNQPLRTARSF